MSLIDNNLPDDIIQELQNRYNTSEERRNLRLNTKLIQEILEIVESKGYEISISSDFPTSNFSSSALEMFESPIREWVQSGTDYYIPSEQILRDLITNGWIIKPPRGM